MVFYKACPPFASLKSQTGALSFLPQKLRFELGDEVAQTRGDVELFEELLAGDGVGDEGMGDDVGEGGGVADGGELLFYREGDVGASVFKLIAELQNMLAKFGGFGSFAFAVGEGLDVRDPKGACLFPTGEGDTGDPLQDEVEVAAGKGDAGANEADAADLADDLARRNALGRGWGRCFVCVVDTFRLHQGDADHAVVLKGVAREGSMPGLANAQRDEGKREQQGAWKRHDGGFCGELERGLFHEFISKPLLLIRASMPVGACG